jgi:glucose-inhibited division protein A
MNSCKIKGDKMRTLVEDYDIVVVGAGHAGCEAALAGARLGLNTVMFTVSVDSIALMPCNPNVGGSSKGHLVRELDALGGEMGKNIDKTFIQSMASKLSAEIIAASREEGAAFKKKSDTHKMAEANKAFSHFKF